MKKPKEIKNEKELLNDLTENYMSDGQLLFFKKKLEAIAKELLNNADETTEHLRKSTVVPDPADRASIEEEHSLLDL